MSAGGAKISDSATSTSLAVYFNRIDYQKGTEVYSLVDAGKDSGREVSDYYLQLGAINYPSLSTRSNSGTILDSDVTIYDASKVAVPDKNDKTIAGTFVAVYTPTVLTSEHTLSSNLHLYWASSVDPASVSSLYAQAGITHFPDLANEYKITVGEGYTFQLDLALEAPAVKASNTAASKITISPSFSVASSAIVDPGLNLQVNKSWNSWSGAWEEWAYYVPACNAAIFNGLVGLFNPANWSQLSGIVGMRAYHVVVLCKNEDGLKDLYRLISESHITYLAEVPKTPRSLIAEYRKNLIIGSACFNGELFELARTRGKEALKEAMAFYDYVEIQPLENYSYLLNVGDVKDKEQLLRILNDIIEAADELGKPICATGDCHYVNPEDKITRDVYISAKAIGGSRHPLNPNFRDKLPLFENPDQHFRSTREMLDSFKTWMSEEKARQIVIKNTNMIADQIEVVEPVKDDLFTPNANLPDSAEKIRNLCLTNFQKTYGDHPDPAIKERLERELDGIIGHGYAVTYYIAHCIIKKANQDGYIVGSRGSVGSSFAAHMAEITEVNPLAPHYLCPKCKHFEWAADKSVKSGFDLPDKLCPECGTKMVADGQNIPFETFLGFNADKVPDIDLNFPPDYQSKAHERPCHRWSQRHRRGLGSGTCLLGISGHCF